MTTSTASPIPAMNEQDVLALRITLSDRYRLLKPIATGGMAEIFLARQKALAGFEKDVAVKLLRDRFRSDARVLEMFLNEARIGAVLNHPNIVHVYDVGEHDKQPFIAMEYIHGEELPQLCRRGLEMARFLPLEHAVDLVRQAAEALGYFHSKRDENGHPLEIVHRDISPSNLIITHDGVLKVIDFGIARASWADRVAPDGLEKQVPGKYNYMSPEQVRGERVDHRSDIFSLGIVLYEITVGKRLFKGRPEEVMQKVTRGRIKPPTFIRRQFPPALERIVMRALESHRDDRYSSAYELASDLEEFLRDSGLKSGPMRIAQYLDELRAAEGGERRPELIIAGEAWLDDDGEEALDFDRGFSLAPPRAEKPKHEPVAEAKPISSPVMLAEKEKSAEKPLVEAAAPISLPVTAPQALAPPPASPANDDEEILTRVASETPPTETRPLRAVPRGEDGEEQTNVQGAARAAASLPTAPAIEDIDPDLGVEESPTDASLEPVDMVEVPGYEPEKAPGFTTPILLTEPTGRVPLTAVTGRVAKVTTLASPAPVANGTGKVPLVNDPGASIAVPLRAEPTGKVALVPAVPPAAAVPPPAALTPGSRITALDHATSDTPLPPIPDPLSYDTTERHPMANLDNFVAASGIRLLKAEVPAKKIEEAAAVAAPAVKVGPPPAPSIKDNADEEVSDSMSVTMQADGATPKRVPVRGQGKKKSKQRRPYRPSRSSLQALEIQPDPAPLPSFGEGLVQHQPKKIPWALIAGGALALILIILLMTL